nr:class I SAM-dependent methyltransferase [Catenibacillus scindens]
MEYICPGDTVVDATAGNGLDTEFLCRLVGPKGCVHAFDIQPEALENTRERLSQAGLLDQACLHLTSHDQMDVYVEGEIAGFCFNLGYLPSGNPAVITHSSTTIPAVKKCLEALKIGGVGCILAYWGHEGGRKEMENVDELLRTLPGKKFEVFRLENHNRANCPPVLYCLCRIR